MRDLKHKKGYERYRNTVSQKSQRYTTVSGSFFLNYVFTLTYSFQCFKSPTKNLSVGGVWSALFQRLQLYFAVTIHYPRP